MLQDQRCPAIVVGTPLSAFVTHDYKRRNNPWRTNFLLSSACHWVAQNVGQKNLVPLLGAGQGTDKACTETKSGLDIFCQLFLIRSGSYEKGLIRIFKRTKQKVKILFYNRRKNNMKHEQFSGYLCFCLWIVLTVEASLTPLQKGT